MYYYSGDFLMMIVFIAIALGLVSLIRRRMSSSTQSSSSQASTTAKPQATSAAQMAEDMRATKTSRVVDAVSILEDLSQTSSNYRHYCELVGNSMASSNVVAPYSKRAVAYYDIKCYRIDATYNGGERETLVAHEHSFDPFFFTDSSCDKPIYVDLESFGNNVLLVNSTNHIEGPNSDFAEAFQSNAVAASSGRSVATAMVAHAVDAGSNLLQSVAAAVVGAVRQIRHALTPSYVPQLVPVMVGAATVSQGSDDGHRFPRVLQAGPGGSGGPDGHRGRGGGRPGPQSAPKPHPSQPAPQRGTTVKLGNTTIHVGSVPGGPGHMPPHLGDFMGGYGGGPWVMGGGPGYGHRPTSSNSADLILGMGLGALLNSMTQTQQQLSTGGTDTFRGYRLVENIVPLGSPVYCIGEIYQHGTDVYMSRSLAKDYPTSYFATKPESEVLSALGA